MEHDYIRLTAVDRLFNRLFGFIVGLGGGLKHNQVLEVRGRKSGHVHSMPVNLMEHQGKLWLVAARGNTQWARNVLAQPQVTLTRGKQRTPYQATLVPTAQRAPLLQEYLARYHRTVQRFFTVQHGAPLQEFEAIAARHPVFELNAIPGDS